MTAEQIRNLIAFYRDALAKHLALAEEAISQAQESYGWNLRRIQAECPHENKHRSWGNGNQCDDCGIELP